MDDLNKVIVTGRLTRNAEMKKTDDMSVTTFAIAVNRSRRKKDSEEYETYPNFINLAIFGKRAESLLNYLRKGTLVGIEGHLEQTSWDKEGEHFSRLDVRIDKLSLLGSGKKDGKDSPAETGVQPEESNTDLHESSYGDFR